MKEKIRVTIIGAGIAGEYLLKELKSPHYKKYNVIGFIDDNVEKIGTKVKDVEVLDSTINIPDLAVKYRIDLFIIAIPSASGQTIQRIVRLIKKSSVNFMIVPPIFQNLNINQIAYPREVSINDLLRRPIKNVLTKESMNQLSNFTFLITGVAGSIGSELCIQLASCFPKRIIGVDCAETPLFNITNRLEQEYPKIDFIPILGNIQNRSQMKNIIQTYKPDFVYHSAAFKHVGLMELFPYECVKNNILGSLNMINESISNKIGKFIFISTDKAVNPQGIMGATKRIIEKYILSLDTTNTKLMITRFGNVLESNGSMIKIFKDQIKKGGPVTITDERMERFFMTITEAAQLVIQASILGKGGELMVLDMGESYKISDIIHRLIELSGFEIDTIPIKIIGKRKGEKLKEELFYSYEEPFKFEHDRIFNCKSTIQIDKVQYRNEVESLALKAEHLSKKELIQKMFKLSSDK